ncbi:MAG: MBL fold metallo-hydrolase [Treponema sp.]|jgi:glyoxylase-like metal-dependent hydrolase (beta-lactamase superfamily II)|nr:MBL fold metallo-hydrolase [Treponema sp.]
MKLFFHSSVSGSNNCYVLGSDPDDEKQTALVIDPGHIDQKIIDFIEDNAYTLGGVLVTHDHLNHVRGITTFKRLYHLDIYAVNPVISEQKTIMIQDGDVFSIPPFRIEAFSIPGHTTDSVIYNIGNLLFTGDSLSAGLVGKTFSLYGARIQLNALQSKIFSLPGDYMVLPGHGPPSSLDVERKSNAGIQFYTQKIKYRPSFAVDVNL